jgi:hypothetical protein
LDRLPRAKQTRPGSYVAGCPCCESKKGRPISIREADDGRILLHAFCGCETAAVLAAIGLSFSDLFDRPIAHQLPPIKGGFSARELLELSAHEATVAAILISDAQTRALTPVEQNRLSAAAGRLLNVQEMVHGR